MGERSLEHLLRPHTGGVGLDPFAVEPRRAQVVWSELPAGRHHLVLDACSGGAPRRMFEVEGTDGPGAIELDELDPGTTYRADLAGSSRRFHTLPDPPGGELFRFATISDLHLGRGDRPYRGPLAHVGTHEHTARHVGTVVQPVDRQLICATAAIDEAIAWGAQLLVVKGDLCEESHDWIWDQAAELLGSLPIPVLILPGNHDTGKLRQFEPEVGGAERGLHVTRGVDHHDVPGLRLLLVDSTRPGNGWGAVERHSEAAADLASEAGAGVFVATHHHPQRLSLPLFWPHGIPGPDATSFARTLAAANPAALVSSGHTHRCRRREVRGVPWTEVAATNHFPGVWAGYQVHEGGLTQVVRRIARPEALTWTERTRRVLGGAWALWATGTRSDRCFTLRW